MIFLFGLKSCPLGDRREGCPATAEAPRRLLNSRVGPVHPKYPTMPLAQETPIMANQFVHLGYSLGSHPAPLVAS